MRKFSILTILVLALCIVLVACSRDNADNVSLEPEFTDDSMAQPADEIAEEYLEAPEQSGEDHEGSFLTEPESDNEMHADIQVDIYPKMDSFNFYDDIALIVTVSNKGNCDAIIEKGTDGSILSGGLSVELDELVSLLETEQNNGKKDLLVLKPDESLSCEVIFAPYSGEIVPGEKVTYDMMQSDTRFKHIEAGEKNARAVILWRDTESAVYDINEVYDMVNERETSTERIIKITDKK